MHNALVGTLATLKFLGVFDSEERSPLCGEVRRAPFVTQECFYGDGDKVCVKVECKSDIHCPNRKWTYVGEDFFAMKVWKSHHDL